LASGPHTVDGGPPTFLTLAEICSCATGLQVKIFLKICTWPY